MRKQLLAGAMAVVLATGMTNSAMAFDRGDAGRFHDGGFHRRGSSHDWHGGWSGRRFVGGQGGWGYSPSYNGAHYEGVAPFGRFVGPATGGLSFFVGM
jgi:hypothetical protein